MEDGIAGFVLTVGMYVFGWVLAVLVFNVGAT